MSANFLAVGRQVEIPYGFLSKDVLRKTLFLAVGRRRQISYRFLNEGLLKSDHLLAVGRQMEIPSKNILRKSLFCCL